MTGVLLFGWLVFWCSDDCIFSSACVWVRMCHCCWHCVHNCWCCLFVVLFVCMVCCVLDVCVQSWLGVQWRTMKKHITKEGGRVVVTVAHNLK